MRARLWAVAAAFVTLAAGAQAAIVLTSTGSMLASATSPPVKLELGASGSSERYFSPFALSANATSATGTAIGRAGGDLYAKDALRVVNTRAAAQSVTLSSTRLSNAQLDVFQWHVYNGATLVASMDVEGAAPSMTFTLPASATYRLDMRLDLADGTTNATAPTSFELRLRVGSGGTVLTHPTSAPALSVHTVLVPLRPLLAGSAVGASSTNGTASVNAPTLLQSTQNVFFLNNTAPTASYVRLVLVASASISDVSVGNVGVASGGTSVDHVRIGSGVVTQPAGSYQLLAPGSTNRLYLTSLEGLLFNGATLDLDIHASDTASGDSYVVSKARLTLT